MNLKEEVDNGQHGTAYGRHTKADSKVWHNGYRAAQRDISERFGLDTVDDIELMVKKVELHDETVRGIIQQLNDEQLRLGKAELKIVGLEQTIEWMGNHVAEAKAENAAERELSRQLYTALINLRDGDWKLAQEAIAAYEGRNGK